MREHREAFPFEQSGKGGGQRQVLHDPAAQGHCGAAALPGQADAKPGKTVHVNYFCIDGRAYFVDLPGYGYASVAKTERARWGKLMEDFFADPARITLGVMIVDARHKPTADDETMAAWFHSTGCPMVVVANKCDKLKKSEIEPNLARIRATLLLPDDAVLLPFSAEKGTGREALLGEIFRAIG